MELNELISRASPNSEVILPSGEFEGPLVINKPLRLRGKIPPSGQSARPLSG